MKRFVFRYPGDPSAECLEMTRVEFVNAFPRDPVTITSSAGVSLIPLRENEVWCDFCGDNPGEVVFLIYGTIGICRKCAEKSVLPYAAKQFKFAKVYCSQCGGEFGPRDSGYSHCKDHRREAAAERKARAT